MISLPEQFHAARQTQIDKQFQLLRVLGDQALDCTGRVLALNLDASRAAVEHSSSAMRQLLAMRDPRDLLNIGAQGQHQLRTLFDYGRELFSIATGLRGIGLQTYPVAPGALAAPAAVEAAPLKEAEIVGDATAAVAASAAAVLSETASDTASATAPVPAAQAAHVSVSAAETAPDSSPVVTSDVAPPVAPTAIARAASEALEVPLAPPHPVAASVPVEVAVEIEIPKIEPVEATPPVAAPAHGAPKVTEIRSGRGRKKQS
ncbi:phasin family protein [Massilia sp.]|uniref:phasin family protein n=1 Tax=Massilia sp. TaxID=1882437 RepID=UPI0028A5FD86|nr:phasin family protein [Massilia sp.]